jgi:outer membrane lipoprotein SlyB
MATDVALNASPTTVLGALHGQIVDAHIGYPQVLHVEVRDDAGGLWRLATQDAEFSPPAPGDLTGKTLEEAKIDPITVELRCKLSDGTQLVVVPAADEGEDDLPNWELITPEGIVLEFGPGLRWQVASADSRASFRP